MVRIVFTGRLSMFVSLISAESKAFTGVIASGGAERKAKSMQSAKKEMPPVAAAVQVSERTLP